MKLAMLAPALALAEATGAEVEVLDLSTMDVILLRQDPPFDLAYITSTHFLERIQSRVLVVNDPGHVRNAPEKVFVMDFVDLMPPTLITRDVKRVQDFRARHGDIVLKPLHGHPRFEALTARMV